MLRQFVQDCGTRLRCFVGDRHRYTCSSGQNGKPGERLVFLFKFPHEVAARERGQDIAAGGFVSVHLCRWAKSEQGFEVIAKPLHRDYTEKLVGCNVVDKNVKIPREPLGHVRYECQHRVHMGDVIKIIPHEVLTEMIDVLEIGKKRQFGLLLKPGERILLPACRQEIVAENVVSKVECGHEASHGIPHENHITTFRSYRGPPHMKMFELKPPLRQFLHNTAAPAFANVNKVERCIWRNRHKSVAILTMLGCMLKLRARVRDGESTFSSTCLAQCSTRLPNLKYLHFGSAGRTVPHLQTRLKRWFGPLPTDGLMAKTLRNVVFFRSRTV